MTIRIGITGAHGFLGFHLRAFLLSQPELKAVPVGRGIFEDQQALDRFVGGVDVLVHLAGLNRADDADLLRVNPGIAQALVDSCERLGVTPQVVYSSTTHVDRETTYGASKAAAGAIFESWAQRHHTRFTNLILPHLFGEYGKPFYNSVTASFCEQLATGQPLKVNPGRMELVHAQQVCALIAEVIREERSGIVRMHGTEMSVEELANRLTQLADTYRENVIPAFDDELSLDLFNTYRSYLFPRTYPVELTVHADQRGSLFEVVKTHHGGQCFVSSTNPGVTRGNHFHYRKVERFAVVKGEAVIRVRKLFGEEVHEFAVTGAKPVVIDMPTLQAHNISNSGRSELVTLFWSHEIFDPANTDTYAEEV